MLFIVRLQVLLFLFLLPLEGSAVKVGADVLISSGQISKLNGKKIGLISNQTAVNEELCTTLDLLKKYQKNYKIVALFAPEHGFYGRDHASDDVEHDKTEDGIPIYSLHGETRRPTEEMLKGIDLLIYDVQDIGSRSYTYITTLFYVMEEAAKRKIPVMVLDRPNPINGVTVDGPMLDLSLRSMVGYINIPYTYGMTIGELAEYFNQEYKIGAKLEVIPMKGWTRGMSFKDTALAWIPTSPYIPESDTPLYYPITGVIGELGIVNIGIGYTLPFKLIGAPWIDALKFAKALNSHRYPGVYFTPFFYKPFYGKFKGDNCQGVLISVNSPIRYKPIAIQFLILGTLKKLYPKEFDEALKKASGRREMFTKVIGTKQAFPLLLSKSNLTHELRVLDEKQRLDFMEVRKKYLNPDYTRQ